MKLTGTTIKKDESTIKKIEMLNNSKEKFVIITNHQSYIDHWITVDLKNCYTALVAKFLLYIPFIGLLMASNSFFLVDRQNKSQIIDKVLEYCNKRPTNICIFPQGGFPSKISDTLLPFRSGAFTLSKLLDYKIAMFVIDTRNVMNDSQFYPGNSIHLRLVEFVNPNDFYDIESLKDYCFHKMDKSYSEMISEMKVKSE
jgi:1-acyl-sn-glycerol-3-phosphate acyltransferase